MATAFLGLLLSAVAGQALADRKSGETTGKSQTSAETLQESTISGESLMDANVSNGLNQVGTVREVVLNEDGSAVEYVLFQTSEIYTVGREESYVPYERLEVHDPEPLGFTVTFRDEGDARSPDTLTLTRKEADHRLLSNLLGNEVHFADGQSRSVSDVLIDRQSGKLKGFVVNEDPDSLFLENPMVLGPEEVSISPQGDVTTSSEFAALEPLHE